VGILVSAIGKNERSDPIRQWSICLQRLNVEKLQLVSIWFGLTVFGTLAKIKRRNQKKSKKCG
jgi:hypothetical protein